MIDYENKIALVTGAASGIGRAVALALAARGAHVILVDIDEAGLAQTKDLIGPNTHLITCDLGDQQSARQLIDKAFALAGPIDLVCSNAGIARNRRLMKEEIDQSVEQLFAVNLFAGLWLAQSYVSALRASNHQGRMIFTGSENSLSVPESVKFFGLGLYGATKHALLIMVEWLRVELAQSPINLHILLPGGVLTPPIEKGLPDPANPPENFHLISPARCAELALKGMDLGLFHIPTHPHSREDMQPRITSIEHALSAMGLAQA